MENPLTTSLYTTKPWLQRTHFGEKMFFITYNVKSVATLDYFYQPKQMQNIRVINVINDTDGFLV